MSAQVFTLPTPAQLAKQAASNDETDAARSRLARQSPRPNAERFTRTAAAAHAPDPGYADHVHPDSPAGKRRARQAKRDDIDAKVAEFNKLYCYVETGSGVMYDLHDPHRVEPKTWEAVVKGWAHDKVTTENKAGDSTTHPFTKLWLEHADANKCKGTIFRPGGDAYITERGKRHLNTWRRLGVDPKPGDWSLMREHIRDVLCAGDPDEFRNVLGWMAWQLQNLGKLEKRLPVVLCFMSEEEGTGKSIVWKYWRDIFGHHAKVLSRPDDILGDKNGSLADCVHVTMEEAFFSGDPRHDAILKELFTGSEFTLRRLYENARQEPNYMSFVVLSNKAVPFALTRHSRRVHALRVSPHRKGQFNYFQSLADQMNAGGVAAMAWDLLHWQPDGGDWSFLQHMGTEHTSAAGEILKERLSPFESWVIDWVIDGTPEGTICDDMRLPDTEGETLLYTMRRIAAQFSTWWDAHRGDYDVRERAKVKVHYGALGKPFRDMLGDGIKTTSSKGKDYTRLADRSRLRAILLCHANKGYAAAIQEREAAGGGVIQS